jgi:hypothetical protein
MESLSKSGRPNPAQKEGFTDIGYQVCNLNHYFDEEEMIALLNKKAEEYETAPIFNEEIQTNGTTQRYINNNKEL